jgi:hypothetical protein
MRCRKGSSRERRPDNGRRVERRGGAAAPVSGRARPRTAGPGNGAAAVGAFPGPPIAGPARGAPSMRPGASPALHRPFRGERKKGEGAARASNNRAGGAMPLRCRPGQATRNALRVPGPITTEVKRDRQPCVIERQWLWVPAGARARGGRRPNPRTGTTTERPVVGPREIVGRPARAVRHRERSGQTANPASPTHRAA